jgi:hypothetical protein
VHHAGVYPHEPEFQEQNAFGEALPHPYSAECVELDFSHLAAYHIASVRHSLKVLATFCGSLRETNPQKVALERSLQLFGEAF